MKITVEKEVFEEITAGRLNHVISSEQWTSMKGVLFIENGEDQVIADVIECLPESGRWLIMFEPILGGRTTPHYDTKTPISEAVVEAEPPKNSEKRKRDLMAFLKSMTEPFNGYYL